MNINLREDETTNYLVFYQNYLINIQQLNNKVSNVLNEIMQESKYDKLQRKISQIIDTYTETIVNKVENGIFDTWVESNGSLRACLKTYRAGDAADEVCAQIEQNMNDLIQDILKIEKAELIVTERPIVSEEGLEQLEDAFRNARTEIQDIKSEYLAQINSRNDDNEIFGTLRPLFEGIASNLDSFFEASLNSFEKMHEFVRGISLQLHNIAEENGVGNSSDVVINPDSKKSTPASPSITNTTLTMGDNSDSSSFVRFKDITNKIYNSIDDDYYVNNNKKKLPYESLILLIPIYHRFYSEYGKLLKDSFKTNEERENYVKREYFGVTKERKNEQFFEGEGLLTFNNQAHHTYSVFDKVAEMERNIVNACINGTASDENLLYGAYVLFNPILDGHMEKQDESEFSSFSIWAAEEIQKILEMKQYKEESVDKEAEEEKIKFEGDNFTEENIKLFVSIVEKMVNQVGVDEINSSVEKYHDVLRNSRNTYSRKVPKNASSNNTIDSNTYGRYTVTRKSIQLMAPICSRTDFILEPIDKFYKEKFNSLGERFDKANKVIHEVSSFCAKWGLGTIKLSDQKITSEDSLESILKKVELGGIALSTLTAKAPTTGLLLQGGSLMLSVLDKAMPHFKKNTILVRLNEKFWNLTRQDIQIPYVHKMMDLYMMEHYEMKYGMCKGQSKYFEFYHSVVMSIKDEQQRRAFENAVFSAEELLTPKNYIVTETDFYKRENLLHGVFLNLVRSGMCSKQGIESGTANDIVDKLYNIYVSNKKLNPRVDVRADQRILK